MIEHIKLLLSADANPNALGGIYGTALQAAAASNCKKAIELLLNAGAIVNIRGGRHGSALKATTDEACRSLLLSWGAIENIDTSDSE